MTVPILNLTLAPKTAPIEAFLQMSFIDPDTGIGQNQWIRLNEETSSFDWSLDLAQQPSARAFTTVSGTLTLENDNRINLDLVSFELGAKLSLDVNFPPKTVWFSGQWLSWEKLSCVELEIIPLDHSASRTLTFTKVNSNQFFTTNNSRLSNFRFEIKYIYETGGVLSLPLSVGEDMSVILPDSPNLTTMSVKISDAAKSLPIRTISVELTDRFGQTQTQEWTPPFTNSWSPEFPIPFQDEQASFNGRLSYSIDYINDQLPKFKSPPIAIRGQETYTINSFGIVQFRVPDSAFNDSSALPLSSIKVTLMGAMQGKSLVLDKANPIGVMGVDPVNKENGLLENPNIQYNAHYLFSAGGTYMLIGNSANSSIYLPNSALAKNFILTPLGLTDPVGKVAVSYYVKEAGFGWSIESQRQSTILTSTSAPFSITLPVIQHDNAALCIDALIINGTVSKKIKAASVDNIIPLGVPFLSSIEIDPTIVEWQNVSSIVLSIQQADGGTNQASFSFNSTSSIKYWTLLSALDSLSYDWEAQYFKEDDTLLGKMQGNGCIDTILTLPKMPRTA